MKIGYDYYITFQQIYILMKKVVVLVQQINRQVLRSALPELKDAKLISSGEHVVAGLNYEYSYSLTDNQKWTVSVIDQSWPGSREIVGVEKETATDDPPLQSNKCFLRKMLTMISSTLSGEHPISDSFS